MHRQIKGLAFILFGILLLLFGKIDPWLPIIGDLLSELSPLAGMAAGVAGLTLVFQTQTSRNSLDDLHLTKEFSL